MQLLGLLNANASTGTAAIGRASAAIEQALERLSTGQRINRAADDPAGLISITEIEAELRAVDATITSRERESLMLGAREGAMSEVSDRLAQLNGLVVQAANSGGLGEGELAALQAEADALLDSLDFTSNTATYNDQQLLSGFSAAGLGIASLRSGGGASLLDGDLEAAQDAIERATDRVSTTRGAIGARQQAIESDVRDLSNRVAELSGARSAIGDTDYAAETAELSRARFLQQAAMQSELIRRDSAEQTLSLLSSVTGVASSIS